VNGECVGGWLTDVLETDLSGLCWCDLLVADLADLVGFGFGRSCWDWVW